MTKKEMNLAVFAGRPLPRVFFQPRLEPWFHWHKEVHPELMPELYGSKDIFGFSDALDLSMRYIDYYTGSPPPVEIRYSGNVKKETVRGPDKIVETFRTPMGELRTILTLTSDKTWWTTEFLLKRREELPAFEWLMENTEYSFIPENFEAGARAFGERGEPQFYLPKSPYQKLALELMRLEDFIYALADEPGRMQRIFAVMDRSYDPLYRGIVEHGGVRIVNFGENIHVQHLSPEYFKRYLLPFYEKRSGFLRSAGIFTHIHIDGHFKPLLGYLAGLPFDGLEALTPEPQGDVSLEAIKNAIGDKVLLDGIPAVYFTPSYGMEALMECVEKLVRYFHPRLVLGISDEIPEGADASELAKVIAVRDYCASGA
jgi:hypothetical protein